MTSRSADGDAGPVSSPDREAHPEQPGRQDPQASVLELERFLPYRIAVLADYLTHSLATTYQARFGIGIPEWRVMAVLGRYEPLSATEVSRRTSMDKPRVSRALRRMVAAGLIDRRQNPDDHRAAVLRLSAKGRETYDRLVPLALAWQETLVENLSEAEVAELSRLLGKLITRGRDLDENPLDLTL